MKYYLNNRDNRANLAANDFDEFFRPFWSMGEFSPKTDIREKDGSVIIETDMPGFDKNDISVGVERRIPYGERETRRKQGKRRKGTLYTQREEKRQLFEELLRRQRR